MAFDRSIDSALQGLRDEQDVILIGKAFIAAEILAAERRSSLFEAAEQMTLASVADTALFKVVASLFGGLQTSKLEEELEKLTIVSFNYDRSFEQIMFMALITWKGLPTKEAGRLVQQMRVWHPYGRLPRLSWEIGVADGYKYGSELSDAFLTQATQSLRTIGDGSSAEAPDDIEYGLYNAHRLIILGCASHPPNFALLQPKAGLIVESIYATAFVPDGVIDHEGRRIRELIAKWTKNGISPEPIVERKLAAMFADEHSPDWTR